MLAASPVVGPIPVSDTSQPAQVPSGQALQVLSEVHVATGVDIAHSQYGLDGAGQTVVVIDSGIAYDHIALGGGLGPAHRVVGGWDFTEERDADPYDDGPAGFHGTHVAGIIGSSDSTHRGVAPGVDLVGLRVFDDQGRGQLEWLEASLQWVATHQDAFANPITAVNLSLGTDWNSLSLPEYAVLEDELFQLYQAGVFVAVAAGNQFDADHVGLSYPAASPHVMPVASHDVNDVLSDFSQRHSSVIVAPGEEITSTVPDYVEDFNGIADDFFAASGTSMAAPYLVGASVLVRQAMQQAGSEITVDSIRNVLVDTADLVWDPATQQTYRHLNVERAIEEIVGPVAPHPIDLGSIDAVSTFHLEARASQQQVQFVSDYHGLLAIEVISPTSTAFSVNVDHGAHAAAGTTILPVRAKQPIHINLPATTVSVELRVTPLITQRGELLIIEGTPGNDLFRYDDDGRVFVNQHAFSFSPDSVRRVTISGGSGHDELELVGRRDQARAVLSPGRVEFSRAGLMLAGNGLERIEFFALGAGSRATFFGSLGPDEFFAKPTHSWMQNGQYLNYVKGAAYVDGWASEVVDRAVLYDSPRDDHVSLRSGQASIHGVKYENQAWGFQQVVVRAVSGGHDLATLFGSPGRDALRVRPADILYQGDDFLNYLLGLEYVTVFGNGGQDSAKIFDGPSDDRFIARPGHHTFETPSSTTELREFSRVEAFASEGADVATFHGGLTDDALTAKPTHSWIESPGGLSYAKGFGVVTASGGGGSDTALLYDSPGHDTLLLGTESSWFRGANFQYDVDMFSRVHAFSRDGSDTVQFVGSEANDQFFAKSHAAWMISQRSRTIAEGFARVAASGSGGDDSAFLLDSDGDDALDVDAEHVVWEGAEFRYDLTQFARMIAKSTGGRDRLVVDDVLAQSMREQDGSWLLDWHGGSLLAAGFTWQGTDS